MEGKGLKKEEYLKGVLFHGGCVPGDIFQGYNLYGVILEEISNKIARDREVCPNNRDEI